jgi:hypothetical protein
VGEIRSRNEHQPHAKGSCCPSTCSQIKADREALSSACGARLEGLPKARRSRWRAEGRTERKLQTRRPLDSAVIVKLSLLDNEPLQRQMRL